MEIGKDTKDKNSDIEEIQKKIQKIVEAVEIAEKELMEFAGKYSEKNTDLKKKIDKRYQKYAALKTNFAKDFNEDLKKEAQKTSPDHAKINRLSKELDKTLKDIDKKFNEWRWKAFESAIKKDKGADGKKFKKIIEKLDKARKLKEKLGTKLKSIIKKYFKSF